MSEEDCIKICKELAPIKVGRVSLLPFHRLGSSKYEAMGLDYAYKNVPPPGADVIEKIKKIYENYFMTDVE